MTCPDLAWLPWWNAAIVYAGLGVERPHWTLPITQGDGTVYHASTDEMSLYHCFLFWGYHDGRL